MDKGLLLFTALCVGFTLGLGAGVALERWYRLRAEQAAAITGHQCDDCRPVEVVGIQPRRSVRFPPPKNRTGRYY